MKYLLIIAAVALLALPGCAASTGGAPSDEALVRCRAEADAAHKARYTDPWQAAVDRCLERETR